MTKNCPIDIIHMVERCRGRHKSDAMRPVRQRATMPGLDAARPQRTGLGRTFRFPSRAAMKSSIVVTGCAVRTVTTGSPLACSLDNIAESAHSEVRRTFKLLNTHQQEVALGDHSRMDQGVARFESCARVVPWILTTLVRDRSLENARDAQDQLVIKNADRASVNAARESSKATRGI